MAFPLADFVIPAKAGIQTINQSRVVVRHYKNGFVRYAEFYDKLDSGLRRNDDRVVN